MKINLSELKELVDRLRHDFGTDTHEICDTAADTIMALYGKLEKATTALEFYADHDNWYGVYMQGIGAMTEDWGDPVEDWPDGKPGKKARDTLVKIDE